MIAQLTAYSAYKDSGVEWLEDMPSHSLASLAGMTSVIRSTQEAAFERDRAEPCSACVPDGKPWAAFD